MIFNYPAYGGKPKATVTVLGAVGESITLTSAKSEVFTVADGGTVTIPVGTYTVVGSISKQSLPNGRTVSVAKGTTQITAYPDSMKYWFGRFASGYDAVGFQPPAGVSLVKNTNDLYMDVAQGYYGGIYIDPKVTRGAYTKLKMLARMNPQDGWQCTVGLGTQGGGYHNNSGWNMVAYMQPTTTAWTVFTADVSGVDANTGYYAKILQKGNDCGLKAVWFE